MAKQADLYFETHPWQVIERGFNPAYALTAESIFSLANEHMGLRGFAEEGYAPGIPHMVGSYLGGVYELHGEEGPGGYKGIVKQTHYMVNAANFLKVRLAVDGQPVVLQAQAAGFVRSLDLRSGLLTRAYSTQVGGKTIHLRFERLVSMSRPQLAAQRLTISSDTACEVKLDMVVDGAQIHYNQGESRWQVLDATTKGDIAGLTLGTATTGQRVLYRSRVQGAEITHQERGFCQTLAFSLQPGEERQIEKTIQVDVDRGDQAGTFPAPDFLSFERMLADNQAHYAAFWRTTDVEIIGDELTQQGIRYCLFQLHQTYRGHDPRNNIGAKGLTGEAYNGHAFWDTETYCLPYYLLNDLPSARNLLLYRHHTLPQAMERAKQLDCEGACYPIATLNGKEACTLWQHASLQMQPSTAVAYGIWHYAHLSGDTAFLYKEGLEMLVPICRYLASRGNWNQDGSGFGYYGVMGPDEFHLMVNNNFYTNFMAQQTLNFTLQVLADSGSDLASEQEQATWREMADKMILLSREDQVLEQHEGYFSLPHLDIHSIPISEFPLYEHWSYDRIYRTDMIKQPDVLMAMFLHPAAFTGEQLRANYEYYEPRCIHESSLSPSVHAILAASLGKHREAERFFGFATRLDLDNYNRNTTEGLHLTSIAAAWVTIVYGFGGLRSDGPLLSLNPFLPESWQGYSFQFNVRGSQLKVQVGKEGTQVHLLSGPPVTLLLHGQEVTIA